MFNGGESIGVAVFERIVMDIGVEVGAVDVAGGVGGKPPSIGGVIISSAKVDPRGFGVNPF